jgi:hypothetical protein
MRVEKLPFTIYDIVGYFLPGAALLASIVFVVFPDMLANLYNADGSKTPAVGALAIAILAATISYALGFCIALIASRGIEDPINAAFGYPSEFLVPRHDHPKNLSHGKKSFLSPSWFLSNMFFLPYLLTPPSQITDTSHPEAAPSAAGWRGCFHAAFKAVFVKKLCPPLIKQFNEKFKRKFSTELEDVSGKQWFNMVQYYVINNNPAAFVRMYNYMTMYGFCRNLSASLYFSAIILSVDVIVQSLWMGLSLSAGLRVGVVIILFLLLSVMLAANFSKFYRRYSQEAVYAFVTTNETMGDSDKSSDSESQKPAKTEVHPIQAAA